LRYGAVINSSTNTNFFSTTSSIVSDITSVATVSSTVAIDWTVNQYLIVAIQHTVAGDSANLIFFNSKIYKAS
jgi:hypothetical protein